MEQGQGPIALLGRAAQQPANISASPQHSHSARSLLTPSQPSSPKVISFCDHHRAPLVFLDNCGSDSTGCRGTVTLLLPGEGQEGDRALLRYLRSRFFQKIQSPSKVQARGAKGKEIINSWEGLYLVWSWEIGVTVRWSESFFLRGRGCKGLGYTRWQIHLLSTHGAECCHTAKGCVNYRTGTSISISSQGTSYT